MASRNQRKKKRTNKRNADNARKDQARATQPSRGPRRTPERHGPRSSTETKSSLRTTELIAYVATVLAVIMTALAVDADGQGGTDPFGAETALRYITYLTIGYLVARGLAKSGSWETHGRGSTFAQSDAQVGTSGPGPQAGPEADAVAEDTVFATPEPRGDGTSAGDDTGGRVIDDDSAVAVLPDDDDGSTGGNAAGSREPAARTS